MGTQSIPSLPPSLQVPTMAVEKVYMHNNTSIIQDEVMLLLL